MTAAEKRARKFLDKWACEITEEAMRSLDPEYLKYLEARGQWTRIVKDYTLEILTVEIRAAETEAHNAAVEACAEWLCQSPLSVLPAVGLHWQKEMRAALKNDTP